jgi:hypothetical protein
MILVSIKSLIIRDAKPWGGFITAFAVYPTEIEEIKALKLDILVLLASEDNMNWIVPELKVKMGKLAQLLTLPTSELLFLPRFLFIAIRNQKLAHNRNQDTQYCAVYA